jgi:hypothetical protein
VVAQVGVGEFAVVLKWCQHNGKQVTADLCLELM